jgi:hypothetical protein
VNFLTLLPFHSFDGATSPEITTQALMLDDMPNGTEFFVLGQQVGTCALRVGVLIHVVQDLIECISHHFIPRSFLPVSPMPAEATYGMLKCVVPSFYGPQRADTFIPSLIRYYNPRTQSFTYFH